MLDYFNNLVEMGRLGLDEIEKNKIQDNIIENKKEFGVIMKAARQGAKNDSCYYCGKHITNFCNSHSIPAFVLRNIAHNGELYNVNRFIDFPLMPKDDGVNKIGTFQLICRECDKSIFREYENPKNYDSEPTPKMLVQIAMKNFMKSISKREFEIELFRNTLVKLPLEKELLIEKIRISTVDLNEYKASFYKAKRKFY